MGDEDKPSQTAIFQGGEGGRGGRGGKGGYGGAGRNGIAGEPGSTGEPGEPGGEGRIKYLGGPISITALVTVILAVISGITWAINAKTDIGILRRDFEVFVDNVKNLNTPLSQRVFSVEARVNEIGRIQQEVRARLESIDANGTTQNKILKRDVDVMRSDIAGQNIRCQEAVRRIDEVQKDTLENKLRIQNIIEAIAPHDVPRRK